MCIKKILRKEMLDKRSRHTSEEIAQMSEAVFNNLWKMPEVNEAGLLMGYLSFGREISLDAFIEHAHVLEKRVCVPYICDAENSVIEPGILNDIHAVKIAQMGIRIPLEEYFIEPMDLDIVLVPGVAFSRDGKRLGMGKGYYDRFLTRTKALRIGICATYNLLDDVPTDEHDALMDYLVTPNGVINCGERSGSGI